MRRRSFITLLGGAVASWPVVASAQQAGMPRIGFLNGGARDTFVPMVTAFRRGLNEQGYEDGRNIAIEYRWAEGRSERYAEIAAELVQLKVDVIVTVGSAVLAGKQANAFYRCLDKLLPYKTELFTSCNTGRRAFTATA